MTETIGDETQRGCFAISYCGGLFHADCFMISFIFYVYVLFMYVLTYLLQLYDVCDNENSHMQLHAGFHFSSTHSRYIEYRISIEGQTHSRCFESWVHRSEVRIYASLVRIISLLYVVHSWLCTVITTLENIENIEPGRRSTLELSIDLPSPLETELYQSSLFWREKASAFGYEFTRIVSYYGNSWRIFPASVVCLLH